MRQRMRGELMLGIATLIWGTALVAQRMGAQAVGPFTFNGVRFCIGALTLLPVLLVRGLHRRGRGTAPANRRLLRGSLVCGGILFATATLQQTGIAHTTAGKAGFITSLYILIVPLLSWLQGKKIAPAMWGCLVPAAAGLYLLCNEGAAFSLGAGDGLVLLCAFTTSLHILALEHYAPQVDCLWLSYLQFLVCGTLSLAAALLWEPIRLPALLAAWKPIVYTGVFSCGIAYTLQASGQKAVPPVAAVFILSLEAVISVASGWIFLRETLSARELAGCTLLLGAALVSQFAALRREKQGRAC